MDKKFKSFEPTICYDKPASCIVDKAEYDKKRSDALTGKLIDSLIVPKKSARTWTMKKGDLCRITLIEGSQVGDLNLWNLSNTKERFYSGKTRQLHSSHLKVYDKLWSCLPYLQPMATFVYDSLSDYGIDKDGGSLHDVIGTRCDDYTYKLITGNERFGSCHTYIREAIKEHNLEESDVHDVWNIFMCTGFTRDTNQYFCKPSPAERGDSIEFIAEMDLLLALSTCPQGDVSLPVGQDVPDSLCHPFLVEIFRS